MAFTHTTSKKCNIFIRSSCQPCTILQMGPSFTMMVSLIQEIHTLGSHNNAHEVGQSNINTDFNKWCR
jgi:hypothetical protein